jgi:hypothetical protein
MNAPLNLSSGRRWFLNAVFIAERHIYHDKAYTGINAVQTKNPNRKTMTQLSKISSNRDGWMSYENFTGL